MVESQRVTQIVLDVSVDASEVFKLSLKSLSIEQVIVKDYVRCGLRT